MIYHCLTNICTRGLFCIKKCRAKYSRFNTIHNIDASSQILYGSVDTDPRYQVSVHWSPQHVIERKLAVERQERTQCRVARAFHIIAYTHFGWILHLGPVSFHEPSWFYFLGERFCSLLARYELVDLLQIICHIRPPIHGSRGVPIWPIMEIDFMVLSERGEWYLPAAFYLMKKNWS